jgi:hypothetical protein
MPQQCGNVRSRAGKITRPPDPACVPDVIEVALFLNASCNVPLGNADLPVRGVFRGSPLGDVVILSVRPLRASGENYVPYPECFSYEPCMTPPMAAVNGSCATVAFQGNA